MRNEANAESYETKPTKLCETKVNPGRMKRSQSRSAKRSQAWSCETKPSLVLRNEANPALRNEANEPNGMIRGETSAGVLYALHTSNTSGDWTTLVLSR